MPRRFCHSCRASLHATDKHWWVCFMLGHRPCWKSAHWDVMSPLRWYVPLLYALAARFIFREQPRTLLLFSSQGPARKSHRGRGFQRPEKSELSPAVKISPVLFTHTDQHSSAAASDLVLFGGSNDGELDDSLSLVASDTEELAGLYNAPAWRVMRHTLSEWSLIAAAVICRVLLSLGDRYLPRACTLVSTWDQEGSIEGYRTARAVSCRTRGPDKNHTRYTADGPGYCATANRPSAPGRRRKITFTSTAWKCWQYGWAFAPFCQTRGDITSYSVRTVWWWCLT